MKRVRVLVSGRVQGVFFRVECARTAEGAGVRGYARNLDDGRVEAVFEGPDDAVESMTAWCRSGPPHARVHDVQIEQEAPTGERGFRTL